VLLHPFFLHATRSKKTHIATCSGHEQNPDTMSHVFAYLRVSTDAQDVDNQRHGVVRYCTDKQG